MPPKQDECAQCVALKVSNAELLEALETARQALITNQETGNALELTAEAIGVCEAAIAKARGEKTK